MSALVAAGDINADWWIIDEMIDPNGFDVTDVANLDRPCDTCDGNPCWMCGMCNARCECRAFWKFGGPSDISPRRSCPADCVDGRHTFDIEVECDKCGPTGLVQVGDWPDQSPRTEPCKQCEYATEGHRMVTRRVSVVPGKVLPIVSLGSGHNIVGRYIVQGPDTGKFWMINNGDDFPIDCDEIDLPSGARPGRYAIQIKDTP